MRLTSVLRTPYRSRHIVRCDSTDYGEEAKLDRAIILTQIAMIALSAARALTDLRDGPRTVEGAIAAAVFAFLAVRLVARPIGRLLRHSPCKRGVSRQFLR